MTIEIVLPYPPSANNYWRTVNGHPVVSKEAREYKEKCGWLAREAVGITEPTAELVIINLKVYRPRKIGDLDNTIKVLLDALKGIVFVDDKQVTEIHAFRYDDRENPRAEIEILRVTDDAVNL